MQSSARESYLVTEVMTAAPQKLQLMLIEAAIRSAERAREKWRAKEDEQACEALIHAQQVVSELLGSLDREVDPNLVNRVASVYLFVFRNLMEANHERNEKKLEDALRVLAVERETWRRVCEQLGSSKPSEDEATEASPSEPTVPPPAVPQTPELPGLSPGSKLADFPSGGHSTCPPDGQAGSGLSLEA